MRGRKGVICEQWRRGPRGDRAMQLRGVVPWSAANSKKDWLSKRYSSGPNLELVTNKRARVRAANIAHAPSSLSS